MTDALLNRAPIQWEPNWQDVDTVLLDMDGTLLDKYFDDYFWESYVPEIYGRKNNLPVPEAKEKLLTCYRKVEGTLEWTDLDYWSDALDLDIPALKMKVDHLIQVHPYVVDFLKYCRKLNKKIHLVTNAHSKTLEIKMRNTAIGKYFHRIICAEEVGMAKEDPLFWKNLNKIEPFDRKRTLLADDNENVLSSAQEYGLEILIYVARPSSKSGEQYSQRFPSILYFKELMV